MVATAPLELPVLPPAVTVAWLRPDEAEEDLCLRKVRVVLKTEGQLWGVYGPSYLVEGYAKRAKKQLWTVVCNAKGVR